MRYCPPCLEKRCRRVLLQQRRENRATLLAAAGVPLRYHSPPKNFVWPHDCETDQDLSAWRGSPWVVTLLGAPGVGKSRLAAEMAYAWLCADAALQDVQWVRCFSLAQALLNGQPPADRALRAQLLIVEGYGAGLICERAWEVLGEFLAQRCAHSRATVVTTRRRLNGLEIPHPPTVRRLQDGPVCRLEPDSLQGG
jgi:hypothetical protein